MKSLKALNSTLQFGCGSRTAKYRAEPAGADGRTFDPSPITKIDVERKTIFKLKSSIRNLIN